MNSTEIMQTIKPFVDQDFAGAWQDPHGQATFDRIVASAGETQPEPRRRAPRRARRRTPRRLLAGVAVAAAAGAAAAVVGIPGLSHNGAPAAWSVTKNPDGTVTLSIRDDRDRAGLQARLRAAGVRATITTAPPNCAGVRVQPSASEPFSGWMVVADPTTFDPPSSWRRSFVLPMWPHLPQPPSVDTVERWGLVVPASDTGGVTIGIVPAALPAADTVTIAFPAAGDLYDPLLIVQVARTGHPLFCKPIPWPPAR
jgi:hypothetical protein